MIVGVLKETFPGERRVALAPASLSALKKKEFDVLIEKGAGLTAGFTDEDFRSKGAEIALSRADVIKKADVVLYVFDASDPTLQDSLAAPELQASQDRTCVVVLNKCDLLPGNQREALSSGNGAASAFLESPLPSLNTS